MIELRTIQEKMPDYAGELFREVGPSRDIEKALNLYGVDPAVADYLLSSMDSAKAGTWCFGFTFALFLHKRGLLEDIG